MASFFEELISLFWPQNQSNVAKVPNTPSVASPKPSVAPVAPVQVSPPSSAKKQPIPLEQCVKWRLTEYYLASQEDHTDEICIPILDKNRNKIGTASPAFFSSLALEGSGITNEGKLVNVAGTWVSASPSDLKLYGKVYAYHKLHLSKRSPSYSGIQVTPSGEVAAVLSFFEVPHDKFGVGFGVCHGRPMEPYRTLATDIGKGKKSDPKFVSGGGVVPLGTDVFIYEFVGMKLPDGSIHDGWAVAHDTGGGIFGAHADCFIGHETYEHQIKVPQYGHIWFDGIDKLPKPYTYGLVDQ